MSLDTRPSELATKWATLLQQRELTDEETAALQDWLLANPAHADALSDACYIIAAVGTLSAEKRAEILALPEERSSGQPSSIAPTRHQPRWRTYALAASALFATVLGVLSYTAAREGWLPRTYQTGTSETQIVHLPDGSLVRLNARTTIRWPGFSRERRTELVAGQALFEVAHDRTHPFYVRVDGLLVRVLGTKFDLNRRSDATILTVLEGAVAVSNGAEHAAGSWHRVVYANQRFAFGPSGLIDDVRQVDASKAVRWLDFALDLDREPLAAVIEELSRYSDRPIILGDDRLKTHRIVGTLQVRDIREALHDLESISPVVVRQDNAAFVLEPRAGSPPSGR
jgi:transmembrane sensor